MIPRTVRDPAAICVLPLKSVSNRLELPQEEKRTRPVLIEHRGSSFVLELLIKVALPHFHIAALPSFGCKTTQYI